MAKWARELQQRWTARRDLLQATKDRLGVLARANKPARWLWPDLPDLPEKIDEAPKALTLKTERRAWANDRLDEMEAARIEALQAALDDPDRRLEARFRDGELSLLAGGTPMLERIYVHDDEGALAGAYWRYLLLSGETRDAVQLARKLRKPPTDADTPAARQFIERVENLDAEMSAIEQAELEMNERLFTLYDLSVEERELVENGGM